MIVRHALVGQAMRWMQRTPRATSRQAAAIWCLTGAEMHLLACMVQR